MPRSLALDEQVAAHFTRREDAAVQAEAVAIRPGGESVAEIAGAALQSGARAVALSLVYPADDPGLAGELTRLRELLPAETDLVAGGRAASAYRDTLESIGAVLIGDLSELAPKLEALRRPAGKSAKNSGLKMSGGRSGSI